MVIECSEFQSEWTGAEEKHDDKRIYSLLLSFFKQIIPELENADESNPYFELMPFLKEEFPHIIEKNFKKSAQIRQVLSKYYDSTFNKPKPVPEPEPEEEASEDSTMNTMDALADSATLEEPPPEGYHAPVFDMPPEENSNSLDDDLNIIPEDAKGSEFFKSKINSLVDEHFMNLFQLYKNPKLLYRTELMDILGYLIKIYSEIPENLISKLLTYIELKYITAEEFTFFVGKCLDAEPSPVIFSIVNYIQESMLNLPLADNAITVFETILDIFAEYVEYYPDYFAGNLNLYVGLIGKINNKISLTACRIIQYYAKLGEEQLEQLFFELYQKLSLLSEETQKPLVFALHDILDGNETFILEDQYEESHEFDKKLQKLINSNLKSPQKPLQDISFEIAITQWNYLAQTKLTQHEPLKKILKPVIDLLKQIIASQNYTPYLFLQAVHDIDLMMNEVNPNHPFHDYEKRFTANEMINTADKFFENN